MYLLNNPVRYNTKSSLECDRAQGKAAVRQLRLEN